ncbi:hypothetical protein L2E82_29005 [Cichorium intybus]|uniref:Uncharacterized protein n=1 Tax=Cichorium intybus TaxID=13427 RepID=A0ACB9CXA1_CICIN|nr:hypothetical protein L2E82_29005 [Cichorium intybus]
MKKPPRSPILRENSFDMPPQNPSSMKQNRSSNRKQKVSKENAPPSNVNVIPDSSSNPSFTGKPSPSVASKLKSLLPPRPPSSNPLKRKIGTDFHPENGVSGSSDTGVKFLNIFFLQFIFQIDIFQLVGAPLVENCLAGFNSSIFAYGQTGSGKTFTIWGPTNAMMEENLSNDEQGLTPRVFERLFSRINEEQDKHADKQLIYQCRCSFLEIYNEQITDLLNPSQKNLHLREDTKTGVYVENLTESTICNMDDVAQLLKKGLSNRRTGATSINIESSRSHSVFTCVVESRCKSMDGLSCFKTSRMNLVDLAGSERQKSTGAAGERLKEAGNINRSLSQLGNLINILAEVSQTGKQRHIPYRDSKLTFLLQESLGGNAKLAMICAISPAESCRSETYSTLRFAQRAKAIKNKAVVNEQMQDNVNTLREVIRQLRDELVRVKASGNQGDSNGGYSTGWNARRSLNLLKFTLNCPMVLPRVDDDGDEEMEIVEENEENKKIDITDVIMEEDVSQQLQNLETNGDNNDNNNQDSLGNLETNDDDDDDDVDNRVMTEVPLVLKSPTPSVSPITTTSRKSLRTSTMLTASQKEVTEIRVSENLESNCPKPSKSIARSARVADRLTLSLHRGLEVIDKHCKSKPNLVRKDIGVQTIFGDNLEEEKLLCKKCNCKSSQEVKKDEKNMQLVPVDDGSQLAEKSKQLVPKAVEKVLAGAIRREMALEEVCTRQDYEINQLNRLLQQYKHERECNLIIGQIREDKIARLESLMDGILSVEEFKDDELVSLTNENKILKENYSNHPEVLRTEIEFKRVQDELERYQNFFELGEKDILLEEIQDLRNQLQSYIDSSSKFPQKPPQITDQSGAHSELESLKQELETTLLLVQKQKHELETEKKCSKELKDAMQMAMEGHARMLEQYADLEEKHINLLTTQRRIEDGVMDIKKAASKAGIKGAESRFINALANEYSSLKAEREKERDVYRDENKGLQEQLKDTAEAVQAASELLVRLKEAEEAVACAEARAKEAEEEKEKAYKEIENLKRKYEDGELTKLPPVVYDRGEQNDGNDPQWEYTEDEELTKLPEPSSWFSGYDSCNI